MIDLSTESTLSLAQAAHQLPPGRGGRPVHFSCVLRWITTGAPGPDGTRVRLEAVRVGGRWITSREALQRFCERLTPRLQHPEPVVGTPTRRRRDQARIEAELAKVGI
jgi:hypothetical protein